MRKNILIAICLSTLSVVAIAGEAKKKPLSPPAKAEAAIAGKKVTIDYSAPSKRGREIMGALVPYGKVWRTGANAATTLTTEADLMIGSLHVPAGKYTLFTIPAAKEWTLIVSKETGQWGTNYDESKDLGRVKMPVSALGSPVETFRIAVEPGAGKKALLRMTWDNVSASVPVTVH